MKYKSCNLLEHGICFYKSYICSCCYAPQERPDVIPYIMHKYNGEVLNKDFLRDKIFRWKSMAQKELYPPGCKNCFKLEEKEWSDDFYIDQVYVTHFENCNLDCIYCINGIAPKQRNKNAYKILPVLDNLKKNGILKQGFEFHIGGGEFSIYPECDKLIKNYVISGFSSLIAISTNGIKYSEYIHKAMEIGKACIIISVDCGSRDLYKIIKRADVFDKLNKNLSLYTKGENAKKNTFLKYIVLPNLNDNKNEFIKFLNLAESNGIFGIKIDIDGIFCRINRYNLDNKLKDYLKWMIEYANNKGFDTETYQFYNQCIHTEVKK